MVGDTTPVTDDDIYYSSILANVKNSYNGSALNKIPIAARYINLGIKDESTPTPEDTEEKTDE